MQTILLGVQVIVALALIIAVLFQRSDADGFGMGSGSAGGMGMLSGRAQANFFTRLTAILAAIFMINSLALTILVAQTGKNSLVDQITPATTEAAPADKATVPMDNKNNIDNKPASDKKDANSKPAPAAKAADVKPASKSVPKAQ